MKGVLKTTMFFNFNVLNRDKWVKKKAASIPGGSKVLDVGAGSCPYRPYFAHCEYFTQDFQQLSDEQLRHGGYGRIDYVCDATQIPVADASFDVVLCTEVIEHVPDPLRLIAEFSRILKPGGTLLLTSPLGSGIHQEPFHYYGGLTKYWFELFFPKRGLRLREISENCGSFAFFSQESIRFIRTSSPWQLAAPLWVRAIYLPIWLILLPILVGVVPMVAHRLDRFDRERRFTVGYHVEAVKE